MAMRFAIIVCTLGLLAPTLAQAQKVEVAPGLMVTRKTYHVSNNEAPFFNFVEKNEAEKAADQRLIAGVLQQGVDRSKAATAAIASGSRAFMQERDIATAAKRFNQAYLLDPQQSGSYHGFAMVVFERFRDFDYADELFQVAARTKSPADSLSADHGRMLLMAGRPADALPLLRKAVADIPDWAIPRMNLALATLQTGDRPEACRLVTQVKGQGLESVERDLALFRQKAGC
jgi:Tfp pilus assembly protein PilF